MVADAAGPLPRVLAGARRWLILGGSGAGKSTLARRLGARLSLPVVHLDRHFWNTGWVETPNDDFDRKVEMLVAEDRWVMDGNYSRTLHLRLPRAQAVVLLDRNPLVCLMRVLRRTADPTPRPDIPEDCPDRLPDRQFLWWILSYRWRSMPKVLAHARGHPHVVMTTLRSNGDVERFLDSLDAEPPPTA